MKGYSPNAARTSALRHFDYTKPLTRGGRHSYLRQMLHNPSQPSPPNMTEFHCHPLQTCSGWTQFFATYSISAQTKPACERNTWGSKRPTGCRSLRHSIHALAKSTYQYNQYTAIYNDIQYFYGTSLQSQLIYTNMTKMNDVKCTQDRSSTSNTEQYCTPRYWSFNGKATNLSDSFARYLAIAATWAAPEMIMLRIMAKCSLAPWKPPRFC